jgi:hypothetical protein
MLVGESSGQLESYTTHACKAYQQALPAAAPSTPKTAEQ